MDTILIVDDNKEVLDILTKGLEIYKSQFAIVTASDGTEAIKILNEHTISLVVTDLMMPNIGGLHLIAYMTKNFQAMPCIVMAEARIKKKGADFMEEGVLRCIEKPFKIKEIAALIIDGLDLLDEGATRGGIALSSFLPLIEMEKMTCLLKIRSATTDNGLMYFEKGILWEASYRELEPIEAAIEMLTWDKVEISFLALSRKKYEQRIFSDLKTLMAEARQRSEKKEELKNLSIPANDPPVMEIFLDRESGHLKNEISIVDDPGTDQIEQEFFLEIKPGEKEKVEEKLSELKKLKGFMSVGIFSPGGEIVAGIYDRAREFEQIGDFMFDIVGKAQKTFKVLNLGFCDMIDITADGDQHLLVKSCHRYNIHFIVVLLCSSDAETELFKHHLSLAVPALVEYLKIR